MTAGRRQSGFSLTEVLLAVMTLAIGMLFVGGTFVLGVHFSTLSTERSIGAIVAQEAFAKLRLYDVNSIDLNGFHPLRLLDVNGVVLDPNDTEYAYPSTEDVVSRQYRWTAIGRRVDGMPLSMDGVHLTQVTVFVVRTPSATQVEPRPVTASWNPDIMGGRWVVNDPNIMDGMNMVHNQTGSIRRISVSRPDPFGTLELANGSNETESIWWMVDPIEGRNPSVGIYQDTIRIAFETPENEASGNQ